MNRKSLFARFADKSTASRTASRQEYFRVHLEPLEDRKLLTATRFVSDYWIDENNYNGQAHDYDVNNVDLGAHGIQPSDTLLDPITNVTTTAGNLAFGKVAYYDVYGSDQMHLGTSNGTGNIIGHFNLVDAGSNDVSTIHSAIEASATGDVVQLEPGIDNFYLLDPVAQTFQESDVTIDKTVTLQGDSAFNQSQMVIAPEVASTHGETDFPTSSHSGIIIYAPTVTIQNLTVDGNAGVGGAGSENFQQGITTMYTLQGGGNYSSQHNGSLAPNHLVSAGSDSSITITGVTVQNVWYHGITISDIANESFRKNYVNSDTVKNIGNGSVASPASNDVNHIGIYFANNDSASARACTVTNAGVGIASGILGTPWTATKNAADSSPGNSGNGRNHSGMAYNTVTDAHVQGYSVYYQDDAIDTDTLVNFGSTFDYGFLGNTATWASSTNTATGLYINFSQPFIMGSVITKAKVGVEVQNTSFDYTIQGTPFVPGLMGMAITGPGSGVAGSVGILIENDATFSASAAALIGDGAKVSSFETGIKVDQTVTSPDATLNVGEIGSATLSGNGTGILIGAGSIQTGGTGASTGTTPTDPLSSSGNATINPSFPQTPKTPFAVDQYANPTNVANGVLAGPDPDTLTVGSVNLNSTSTYAALISAQSGSHDLFNFNAVEPAGFPSGQIPPAPSNRVTGNPTGASGSFTGTQDGSGALVLNGTNGGGGAPGFLYGSNYTAIGGSQFVLEGTDIHDSTTLNVVAKLTSGNLSPYFMVGIADVDNDFELWMIPTSLLNSSTYTTVSINLLSSGLPINGLGNGFNGVMDLYAIDEYIVGADFGQATGTNNIPFKMSIDDIYTTGTPASQLVSSSTGSVTLGNAALQLTQSDKASPTAAQVFKIVDNQAAGAISGTFNGLAEGAHVAAGNANYKISYVGGTGNDVTLTQDGPLVDANGFSALTATITNITAAGALGSNYRLTLSAPTSIQTGAMLTISGVVGSNMPDINASWVATRVDSTHLDLQSSKDILGSYTSGGSLTETPAGASWTPSWTNTGSVNIVDTLQAGVADSSGANLNLMKISFANTYTGDTLTANTSGTSITATFGSGTLTLSGSDTPAHYQQVLRTVLYNNTDGGPGVVSDQINIVATDVSSISSGTDMVYITQPQPLVDLGGQNYTTSNWSVGNPVNIANVSTANIIDSLATNLSSLKISFDATHGGDTLTANTTGTSITAAFGSGTLTLSGSDTVAHYAQVLKTVLYDNSGSGPGVSSETLSVRATDTASNSGNIVKSTVIIGAANTPPVVDLDTLSGGINYTVSTSASLVTGIAIANGANSSVTDADSVDLASLTAAIVGTHAGDTLTANTSGTSISASYASGTLSLTGSDTPAHYQTVLQTIKYGSSGAPGVDTITIDVTANDGSLNSTTAVTTINLTPAIDLDTVASGTGFTTGWYNSGTNAGGQVPISNMTNATVTSRGGANLTGMTITLTSFHTGDVLALATLPNALGLNISQSYSSGTLSLTGSDTAAHYQEALRFVSYNNTTGTGPGVASVTANVVATDGVLSSNTAAATININNGQSGGGQVLGNRLFYNNSKYDGNNTAINGASDDAAIATDKIGYLQGTATAATYASVSNFFRGITGVMVDLQSGLGTHSNINLTSNDISFKFISAAAANASVVNNVGAWGTANSPVAISTRIGAGTGGSDRIEITWNNGSIKQGWLEVDVKANANTGLTNPDIFFFGSLIGDSSVGDSAAAASTNTNDVTPPRNNLIGLTTPVWNLLDYTRDGQVNTNDPTQAANNPATLRYMTNPTGPYAPDAGGGVASGLTAGASTASSGSSTTAPAWLVSRLQSAGDLNTGDIAVYFQQLAAADTPDDQAILLEADQAASDLGLNDDLVDSLLADLGLV